MMRVWLLWFLVASCLSLTLTQDQQEFKLPSYMEVCHRDDPNVADCLKESIEKLVPIFKSGSKEFDLEPLDPFVFKKLVYNYESSILGGHIDLRNTQIRGFSGLKVQNMRPNVSDPNKFIMDFDVYVPRVNVKTRYSMSGNIVTVPVKIKGHADIDFDHVNLTYHIDGDVKRIGNYDYIILNKFMWRLKGEGIKRAHLHNKNSLVDGRPALNRFVVTVIHSGWRFIKDHIQQAILPLADKSLTESFSKFFKKYPYDVIFPKTSRTVDVGALMSA